MPKYKLIYEDNSVEDKYFKNYMERDAYVAENNASGGLEIVAIRVQNKVAIIPTDFERPTLRELCGGSLEWRRW